MADRDDRNIPQRSAYIPDEQWKRLRIAQAIRSNAEDRDVGISELLRRGAERELQMIEGDGEYELPDGYESGA